jgi:hypothetical protein
MHTWRLPAGDLATMQAIFVAKPSVWRRIVAGRHSHFGRYQKSALGAFSLELQATMAAMP